MKHKIIKPSGILDGIKSNELRIEVTNSISEEFDTIVLDLEYVTLMNSSALGALVATLKSVKLRGVELILYSLSPQVKMIFELTRMDEVFRIYRDFHEYEQIMLASIT